MAFNPRPKKKLPPPLKAVVLSGSLLVLSLLGVMSLFFGTNNDSVTRFRDLYDVLKWSTGGVVYNEGVETLIVTDWRLEKPVLPHQNSRELGIWDVDSVYLEQPTVVLNRMMGPGYLKFCDLGRLHVQHTDEGPKIAWDIGLFLCDLQHDVELFQTLKEAFPMPSGH
jgi:hypothetical protein